jgi:hypothetical protein
VTELRRGCLLGSLHGAGEGQRGGHGTAAQEEEVAEPPARVREGGREGGAAWWVSLACWAARGQKAGWLLGRKLKENSFPNKNWIFEYTKALEICSKRFRRNFDMGIFPKFFYAPQGF